MDDAFAWNLTTIFFLADLALRILFSLRVIMRKRAPSVSFAWLVLILLIPFVGVTLYLLFGENRLGERRAERLLKDRLTTKEWYGLRHNYQLEAHNRPANPEIMPLERQIRTVTGIPAVPGNRLELLGDSDLFFKHIINDIKNATSTCHLEFYILQEGGLVDDLLAALLEARKRGLDCRLLLDSIGSKKFLRSATARALRRSGVQVAESLPAGLIRAIFVRIDLRNHRKIAIIDGKIAYTGSQNLVDPAAPGKKSKIGPWVDAMVRITGPVVELLTATFMIDWAQESERGLSAYRGSMTIPPASAIGEALVQLAPSGPGYDEGNIHDLLLTTIYAARKELVLTTPYFVPDNAILAALKSAAQRGVTVTIVVPERNDAPPVYYASRARFGDLVKAGVRIMIFSPGLLHAKTITVDGDFSLFGSVNLDMRSFWLNFEMTLFIYNQNCTAQIRALQEEYMRQSQELDMVAFARRSFGQRLLENIALLMGPLL